MDTYLPTSPKAYLLFCKERHLTDRPHKTMGKMAFYETIFRNFPKFRKLLKFCRGSLGIEPTNKINIVKFR